MDFKEIFTASMILFAIIDIIGATPIVISLREKVGKIESEKATIVSMFIMIGFLGFVGWKVTVISSNFIALMLILTMAMNIHMSTRFIQLRKFYPNKNNCLLYTSPSPRDRQKSRMPSSA